MHGRSYLVDPVAASLCRTTEPPSSTMLRRSSVRVFIRCLTANGTETDYVLVPAMDDETIADLLTKVRERAISARPCDLKALYLDVDDKEPPVRLTSHDMCSSVLHDGDRIVATVDRRKKKERAHVADEVPNASESASLHISARHRGPYAQPRRNAVPAVSRVQSWEHCKSRRRSQCTSAYTFWHPFPSQSPDTEKRKRHSAYSERKYSFPSPPWPASSANREK